MPEKEVKLVDRSLSPFEKIGVTTTIEGARRRVERAAKNDDSLHGSETKGMRFN